MLGDAGGGTVPGRRTRDRPWQAAEARITSGGMEKCGFEQDFVAAEKPAELLGREVGAGVSSAASKAG